MTVLCDGYQDKCYTTVNLIVMVYLYIFHIFIYNKGSFLVEELFQNKLPEKNLNTYCVLDRFNDHSANMYFPFKLLLVVMK